MAKEATSEDLSPRGARKSKGCMGHGVGGGGGGGWGEGRREGGRGEWERFPHYQVLEIYH